MPARRSGIRPAGSVRHRWRFGVAAVIALAACVVAAGRMAPQQDSPGETIQSTRSALERWVESRRIISKEKRDWELGREILNERIALVEREIAALRERISEAEGSITEADEKRAALVEENESLRQAATSLEEIVERLEDRTRELLVRLPDPIEERVLPLTQRLPVVDAEETKQSLSERFQNIVGILNEINRFNREITVTSEVRTLPDGTAAEVTALYVGIGQAFYVGANGKVAGIGRPSSNGWVWTPADDAAPQIAETIAILQNEQVASFVKLPFEIK